MVGEIKQETTKENKRGRKVNLIASKRYRSA